MLTWSKELPTVEGWYWIRAKNMLGSRAILETKLFNGKLFCADAYNSLIEEYVKHFPGMEWAGPIPEPVPLGNIYERADEQ